MAPRQQAPSRRARRKPPRAGRGRVRAPIGAGQRRELVRDRLIESRLTPNSISLTGLALNLLAAVLVWEQLFFLGGIAFKQLYGRAMFRSLFRDEMYAPGGAPPLERIDWHYDSFNSPSARESAYAVLLSTLDTRAVVARLPRIVAPTLVLWGRDDRICPVAGAHRLIREIPGAKLEIMDAGHVPHEERPREFLALLTEFLEGKRG